MKKIICLIKGHKKRSHIDVIYGNLLRKHIVCLRCDKTLYFEKCSEEVAENLPLINCFD